MTSSVPGPTFGANGFIAPAEPDILAGVQADINAAFGGNLNPALETPQGQLASSETAIIGNVNDTFLYLTNMLDPAFSEGRYQDGLARVYFIERNPSQPTIVQAVCSGLPGVVIPPGVIAVAADGNQYVATAIGTIGQGGSVVIPFACTAVGPIPCPAGTLATIYRSIPGWDMIANPADGILGINVETRDAFEARRALAVAHNSLGSVPSVLGAVLTVPGVIDARVIENPLSSPQSIGGFTLGPNSIYVAALGGNPAAVAQAIWSRKAPGCAYNGNTSVTVLDMNPGYVPPYPSYVVSYEIPLALNILFSVVMANSAQVPADAATQIQNAIISAFAGLDGGPRARIGTPILASRFYAPIAALGPWAQIVSLEIGSNNNPDAVFIGSIAGTVLTISSMISGAIIVGGTITDAGGLIAPGTVVAALGTGTGGAGTYVLSASQVIGSRTMTSASPTLFKVPVNISQYPAILAQNIAVSLQ